MSAKGQIAIVTGGNKGLGKEIVRQLTAKDKRAKVYIASKNKYGSLETIDELVAENMDAIVKYLPCDLGDFYSIDRFVENFKFEEIKLHLLVCNSDVMWGPRRMTKHGIELQLGVNHVGHFYLANQLLDHMQTVDNRVKTCTNSKIVVVTSPAHVVGKINFDDLNWEKSYSSTMAYAQSKLANILWMRELAKRLEGTKVVCNAVTPGVLAKGLQQKTWKGYKNYSDTALLAVKVAIHPDYEFPNGQFYGDQNHLLTTVQNAVCSDMDVAAKLWTATEKLIETHQEHIPVEAPPPPPPSTDDPEEKKEKPGFNLQMLKDPASLAGFFSK